MNRRSFLLATAVAPFAANVTSAEAGAGLGIGRVRVEATPVVLSRIRYDMAERVRWRLSRFAGAKGGRPADITVTLHTIDAYAGGIYAARGVSVRYAALDPSSGRVLFSSRFLKRIQPDDRDLPFLLQRRLTRRQQEFGLADRVARQIARDLS